MAKKKPASNNDLDLLWGVAEIAREIGRTPAQTYRLLQGGRLKGAVQKLGHRTVVGSRKELAQLATRERSAALTILD